MARDRANLRVDIWGDSDWRALSFGAQWLYEYLLTCSSLSYVGVADWRPARLTGMASGLTVDLLRGFVKELTDSYFIVTDPSTEEVLIRSFLRHDGVLANPNLPRSIGKDFSGVASPKLRGVISHEMNRLEVEFPEGFGKWNVWHATGAIQTLMKADQVDIRTPQVTPLGTPSHTPSDTGSPSTLERGCDTTTTTSTTTEASLPTGGAKMNETRLSADWVPTASHYKTAEALGVNIVAEAESFRLHAETHDRHAAVWNSAFTTWLKKAKPTATTATKRPANDWMSR